ncbi:unnamed protein product [Cylindrotheca closterium]|uniref:Uncharacterized protein n=1 Tax=Cylindrotheca closterium TaxID=2856 RepID=A0AAD2FXQ4_9STRA|nr:unnamed protein product [Cylindrotheca closterium]
MKNGANFLLSRARSVHHPLDTYNSSNKMPSNEASLTCYSRSRIPEDHNEDSLVSLFIAASVQSSASPPQAVSLPFSSFSFPSGSQGNQTTSVLELLSEVANLIEEGDSRGIDGPFQLVTNEALSSSHGKQEQ